MAQEEKIYADGIIIDILPSDKFKVQLENGAIITGYISGRIRINKIRLIEGDKVEMELSPYDLSTGRITYRY